MKKVTPYTLSEHGSGTLIKTFDKLDEVRGDDTQKVIAAAQLQAKISQELEQRGWIYDESLLDWVYPL